MNRIREIRTHLGLTQEQLADRMGVSRRQVGFLETGERGLDLKWMGKVAKALGVAPQDLIIGEAMVIQEGDVEPIPHETMGAVGDALAAKNLWLYKVTTDAVSGSGININETITVEQTAEAIARMQTGDIALCRLKAGSEDERLILRVYIQVHLFTTNRRSSNVGLRRDDESLGLEVLGVVVRRR